MQAAPLPNSSSSATTLDDVPALFLALGLNVIGEKFERPLFIPRQPFEAAADVDSQGCDVNRPR